MKDHVLKRGIEMQGNPKGCSSFGGSMAAKLEYCRNRAMELFALYGYRPFSPAELQLLSGVWDNLPHSEAEKLIALTSPYGEPCVLRGDLTLSAVTYLSTHFSDEERPLRLSYAERVFSVPKPPKHNLEQNQIGIELIGWEGAGADVELLALLFRTLDMLGIDSVIALGDMSVTAKIFSALPKEVSEILTGHLMNGSYTAYEKTLESLELPADKMALLSALPSLRGGVETIDRAAELTDNPALFEPLKKLCASLDSLGYGKKICIDFSFLRELGYYSGPVFNVYTKEGTLLGGGGRYDGLLAKLGMDGEAAGFALDLKELADNCSGSLPLPKLMLWCGAADSAEVLKFAEELRSRGISFELSWNKNREESKSAAHLRKYGIWADFSEKKIYNLNSGREYGFDAFDGGLL